MFVFLSGFLPCYFQPCIFVICWTFQQGILSVYYLQCKCIILTECFSRFTRFSAFSVPCSPVLRRGHYWLLPHFSPVKSYRILYPLLLLVCHPAPYLGQVPHCLSPRLLEYLSPIPPVCCTPNYQIYSEWLCSSSYKHSSVKSICEILRLTFRTLCVCEKERDILSSWLLHHLTVLCHC